MTPADLALEERIADAKRELLRATTSQAKHAACDRMTALINSRSPERVAQMEIEKGLRPTG